MKSLIQSFICILIFTPMIGCGGGGGEAKFDPSKTTEYTAADEKAAEDYEEQLKKEHEEQYGN